MPTNVIHLTGIALTFNSEKILAALICIGLAATSGMRSAAAQQDWPRVVDIEVHGLTVMPEAELLGKIRIRKGDVLSPETIAMLGDDIRSILREEGVRFEIQQQRVPDGVILIINVLEERQRKIVMDVKYSGDGRAGWFRDVVRLRRGDEYSEIAIATDLRRIRQVLREKGYMHGSVTHTVRETAPGQLRVTFEIDSGPKFQLKRLIFAGNESFSHGQLARYMSTKVDGWLTSRSFDPEQWERDIFTLNQFYLMNGYREASVTTEMLAIDYQNGIVEAVVRVREGPRFRIGRISFEGNREIDDAALAGVIKLEPGDYYTFEDIRGDMQALNTYYTTGGRGFAMVDIQPDMTPGFEPDEVDLTFNIEEGRPTIIRSIRTAGNFVTKQKVIVREMRLEPGDVFDSGKLNDSMRRLRDLRYFESIDYELAPVPPPAIGAAPDFAYADLSIDVVEQPTGSLQAAAGYSSDNQVVGSFAVEQRNFDISNLPDFRRYGLGALNPAKAFAGGGQLLRLVAEPGNVRSRYSFEFEEPWFFDYPIELGLSGYYFQRFFDSYAVQRTGGTIGFGKRYGNELALNWRYRLEGVRVYDLDDDAPIDAVDVKGSHRLGSWLASIRYDTRDSTFFPTDGGFYRAYTEVGGPLAGGNVGFWKQGLEATIYKGLYEFPRGTTHVLRIGAETGFMGPAFGDADVPIFERFFAGGIGSFRGFEYQGIGPRQTDPPTGDTALGGRFLFLGTAEYIIPLYKEDYQLYIFSDIGTLSDRIAARAFDRLRVTAGLGFRFFLPYLGAPITLNFATPLRKESEDRTEFFSFSFGLFF